jgi:aldehyde dehydrogenase (NAD+)
MMTELKDVRHGSTLRAKMRIAGEEVGGDRTIEVRNPYTGAVVGTVPKGTVDDVRRAISIASGYKPTLTRYDRYRILLRASELIEAHREQFVETIIAEAGFPASDASNEVSRTVQTFVISAEEAKRLTGEVVPIEAAPGNAHRMAFSIRVPRGVVCGITSFNSPLNMVAHKVAPALASGNTVVIKPPHGGLAGTSSPEGGSAVASQSPSFLGLSLKLFEIVSANIGISSVPRCVFS